LFLDLKLSLSSFTLPATEELLENEFIDLIELVLEPNVEQPGVDGGVKNLHFSLLSL